MKYIYVAALFVMLLSCKKDDSAGKDLKTFLSEEFAYVHEINGFYMVGSNESYSGEDGSTNVTPKEIFEKEVQLFSSFLDADEDGEVDADMKHINEGMAKHFVFCVSHEKTADEFLQESEIIANKNLFVMANKTDKWPFLRDFTGGGFTVSSLTSSTWRPENYCPTWEEAFHTITETFAKIDSESGLDVGDFYRDKMEQEISAKVYDIEQQNQEENGEYDKVTATNEYLHQIWLIAQAGKKSTLTTIQAEVLQFMEDKGVPMKVNSNYSKTLGVRIK